MDTFNSAYGRPAKFIACLVVLICGSAGCVGAGLTGVPPYVTEIDEARDYINSGLLPSPRRLPPAEWEETLRRIEHRIAMAAVEVCGRAHGTRCRTALQSAAIVQDDSINAWVDQNHRIGVHSGLLANAGSDEEIAAVLAHEYGHIFAGHFDRKATNAGAGALVGMLAGAWLVSSGYGDAHTAVSVVDAATNVGVGAFSQQYELEADYYAALILNEAGVDLDHGRDLLRRLAKTSQGGYGAGVWATRAKLMASTHPANDYRIARWLGVSRALEEARRVSPESTDAELRHQALRTLLETSGGAKGAMTRWINPETGNAGVLTLRRMKASPGCARQGSTTSSCASYDNNEHRQEGNHWTIRYACAMPDSGPHSWKERDGSSWTWVTIDRNPWGKNGRACRNHRGVIVPSRR